jgi:hypothetical protein
MDLEISLHNFAARGLRNTHLNLCIFMSFMITKDKTLLVFFGWDSHRNGIKVAVIIKTRVKIHASALAKQNYLGSNHFS